jgi:hypothetical protein
VKKIILAGILLSAQIILLAQNGDRFRINPASVWRVDSVNAEWEVIEKTKYFIHEDTLINSLSYYKLYKSGYAMYDMPFWYNDIYVGAIREADNEIYFIKKNRTTETWLYDFNMDVGDTIKAAVATGETILSIDTLPGGRRIFNYDLDRYTTGFLVEGIGSNGGLLSSGTSFIPLHSGQCACFLICYAENGDLVYQNTTGLESNCEIVNTAHRYTIHPTAKWRVDREIDNDTRVDYARYQYYISGDTLIDFRHYFKLYKKNNELTRTDAGEYTCVLNENKYMGAIRDKDNKFYFIREGSLNEVLLYDFTLEKGEKNTAEIYKDETVFEVDTFMDNRKIIYLGNDRWNKIIIAGIGSVIDFLDEKEMYTWLTCYSENDVPVYHHPGAYDCELKLSDATFPVCNTINVLPDYWSGKPEKYLEIVLCFQMPYEYPLAPLFSGYEISRKDNTFGIELYYDDPNPAGPGGTMTTSIVADTVLLGALEQGFYKVECSVNAVHTADFCDTAFEVIRFDQYFNLMQNPYQATVDPVDPRIRIFPVPSDGRISIGLNSTDMKITSVEVHNLSGMRVFYKNFEDAGSMELDLTGLGAGMYILKINEKHGCSAHKIIIE